MAGCTGSPVRGQSVQCAISVRPVRSRSLQFGARPINIQCAVSPSDAATEVHVFKRGEFRGAGTLLVFNWLCFFFKWLLSADLLPLLQSQGQRHPPHTVLDATSHIIRVRSLSTHLSLVHATCTRSNLSARFSPLCLPMHELWIESNLVAFVTLQVLTVDRLG